MRRNIAGLKGSLRDLDVKSRAHVKTSKCPQVAFELMETTTGPAAVSTLREAEEFAAVGVRDILYAVGISPQKLARVAALRDQGIDVAVVLDSLEQATAVAAVSRQRHERIPALIEID